MGRLSRAEVFDASEVAICHVFARVVRRCFLLGNDPVTGKNYDHRKVWIEQQLQRLAANFGIDLLCFSILSNHFHLILRSRPDVVESWDDGEVARRWMMLCPVRKKSDGSAEEPNEFELNSIRNDPDKLKGIRMRLSDISWWMRLLCQNIAMRANREDQEIGKFWQARYRAVRLLDEEALLACSAYVDLNPIRAAIAETIETSDYTSAQRRVQALQEQADTLQKQATTVVLEDLSQATAPSKDCMLSPLSIDERNDPVGPHASLTSNRCSDKGFLSMSVAEYLELLDWTARLTIAGKRGATPEDAPKIFERLSIDPMTWTILVRDFGRMFCQVAGNPKVIDGARSRKTGRRFYVRQQARELLASP